IAAEMNELTAAFYEARDEAGRFDLHRWGREGITHLTPLWLLKFLPNMLACHVTIIHDAQGPSNTITCSEASAMLSIGESLRVIQRGTADACFCGGAEDKLNPMSLLRQHFTGRLNTGSNENPTAAVRPFDRKAAGTVVGQGGAIVILESAETFAKRREAASGGEGGGDQSPAPRAYAEVLGFGASQTVHLPQKNLAPDPNGRGIALAIRAALREAKIEPDAIDLIIPGGLGVPDYDQAEAAALFGIFGPRLKQVPIASCKPLVGSTFAGAGGIDVCMAAKAIAHQKVPAVINCDEPLSGLNAMTAPSRDAKIGHVLTYSTSFGGQNAALVLKRID
ncbi:MAG: beta-ketoacyl synthase N-terminal-like domain-containing protein, partial [Phycisphaeraceae bacterium]